MEHMKIANGWDVFLKIKELSAKSGDDKMELHANTIVQELGLKKELVEEYLTALSVLKFIEFKNKEHGVFVISDLGQEQ